MNFRNETIYIKAKELRKMITETVNSAYFESSKFSDLLDNLSLQIPFQIGMCINSFSFESKQMHLEKAEDKLIELYTAVDLHTSEYFKIDNLKFDSLVDELHDLLRITLRKAEDDERKRIDEIMEEFMVKDNNETSF